MLSINIVYCGNLGDATTTFRMFNIVYYQLRYKMYKMFDENIFLHKT